MRLFPCPARPQGGSRLRKASLSPATAAPLSCFPWLFLLPGLGVGGLRSRPGASGPSSSAGLPGSAVSTAGETGSPFQAWLLARGNCPRPGAQRTGLSSPISLGGGQVLGTPTCGRASSYKTCSRSPAWGRQGVRGPLPVSPWCNCKYQDCSLQIPGPSPNPSL